MEENPWTVEHTSLLQWSMEENPWTVKHASLLKSFPDQEVLNCCLLQTCSCAIINNRPHQYKYIIRALSNGWVDMIASNAEQTHLDGIAE